MSQSVICRWVRGIVALVEASVVAVTPLTVPLPGVHRLDIQLISGTEDITIDFVRHGQSVDNAENILGTTPPGVALTNLGQQQADQVASLIHAAFPTGIDEIYSSGLVRTQETAQPLMDLFGMNTRILPGLDEINAGMLEGAPLNTLTEMAYVLPTVMWILGLYFVPMLGSIADPNGMAFQDSVSAAVQTIYNTTVADPNHQPMIDVVFSSAGTIAAWTLMNVKNPDVAVAIKDLIDMHAPLPNTGQVVIEGNPQDGWTLVSWDGTAVPQDPGLLTSLFLGFRDLITAPQMALWNLWEAVLGGQSTPVTNPMPAGFEDVLAEISGALNGGAAAAGAAVSEGPLPLSDLPAI